MAKKDVQARYYENKQKEPGISVRLSFEKGVAIARGDKEALDAMMLELKAVDQIAKQLNGKKK